MEEVKKILSIDRAARENNDYNDDRDLFKLEHLDYLPWMCDMPTLVSKTDRQWDHKLSKTSFHDLFQKTFPFLKLSEHSDHFLLAGDCVSSFLLNAPVYSLHVLVHGFDDKKSATEAVQCFFEQTVECYKNWYATNQKLNSLDKEVSPDIQYSVSSSVIKLKLDEYIIDVLLGIYPSKSYILHQFDLGASAVGFDGRDIYFTSLSKFCYQRRCHIVDSTRRTNLYFSTYEKRLQKYFDQGFRIILPELDLSKLSTANFLYQQQLYEVAHLPYFPFSYTEIDGGRFTAIKHNRIIHESFQNRLSFYNTPHTLVEQSPEDEFKCDEGVISRSNWIYFLRNGTNTLCKGLVYVQKGGSVSDALRSKPVEQQSTLIELYDEMKKQMLEGVCLLDWKPYFQSCSICDIVLQLRDVTRRKEYVEQLISDQVKKIWQVYNELPEPGLNWQFSPLEIVDKFERVPVDPSEWYGTYYLPLSVSN